ncbi:hypothetical protein FG386_003622 [Cryptosporidium ryanae]|uniref:uncharacterized protein n=1 Tax=Cryptosporidium ryanae TaxID=515981 RepID=UPI00351A34C9|nr:hypothetical protein FG386_003622 [Cryptosporidium ryanae]
MLNKLESTNINININTTAVESVYHLLFILFKNRPDLLDYALEKKDFLNSFIYISLSMHTYSLRFICERESKHSEWIFFLFKYIITKDPSYFCDLYSFECSEDTTMECDSSLMYLTILEPFVRISMIKNNLKNISDLMMPQAIREIQNFISKTIISSLEYKDILLNIIFELDTNVNLKDANNKSILFSILQEKINKEIAICEMNKYYSHLSKYLTEKLEFVKVNNTLLINNHSNTDVGISNIVNIKTWISLFQIELDNYEFDNSFFEEIFRILSSILKCMLDFRREFIKFEEIKIKVEGSIWTNTSQVVSISSLLQAILTISLKNKYLLSKIKELDEGKFILILLFGKFLIHTLVIETIVECTKITDENHPLIKESSMLLLRALSESSYELANKIFKYSKN